MKHERARIACPETKEQVLQNYIKTWDVLVSLQQEVEDLAKRMRTRIAHIENNDEWVNPTDTDEDSKFNK